MNTFSKSSIDKKLQNKLSAFLAQYGASGLEQALDSYADGQQEYICRTKTSISKIHVSDIDYIMISGHHMTVHAQCGIFQKYGTLQQELKLLSSYGFIKCTQNCIVALHKIKCISQNDIILTDDTVLHMSRGYAAKVIMAFSLHKK